MAELSIFWTLAGDLRVDDVVEDQPKLLVNFYDWRRLSNTNKLKLLRVIIDTALELPELAELADAVDPHAASTGTPTPRDKANP